MRDNTNALIIFLKYPETGTVKTRLGKVIGMKQAALIYRAFVEDFLVKVSHQAYHVFLAFTPPERGNDIRQWLGREWDYFPQKGLDLGDRMFNAFSEVMAKGYNKVLLIGSDIPQLSADTISIALMSLEKFSMVLGPSEDAGYYLVGLTPDSLDEDLFRDISWSTNQVWGQTLNKVQNSRTDWFSLQAYRDIDELEDLIYLSTHPELDNLEKTRAILSNIDFSDREV